MNYEYLSQAVPQEEQSTEYTFNIMYPKSAQLDSTQATVMQKFPQCIFTEKQYKRWGQMQYTVQVYSIQDPQGIIMVANALKSASPKLLISSIRRRGEPIYYHPAEKELVDDTTMQQYKNMMKVLPKVDRLIHDYLYNMYKLL